MAYKSISYSLLTRVLSVYFLLTLTVTAHKSVQNILTQNVSLLVAELQNQQSTFNGSLTRSLWEFNTPQIETIADGLISIPAIAGVLIRDESGKPVIQIGETLPVDGLPERASEGYVVPEENGTFGFYNALIFEFSGHSTRVGDVSLFTTRDIAIDRIKISLHLLSVMRS